jgi:predicted transcriptional regulator
MNADQHDLAQSLLRRASFLQPSTDETLTRRELEQDSDTSRTTVYRATNELEADDLLEAANGGYRTTPKGAAMNHAVEQYLTTIDTIERLEPLFERVDHPELFAHAHLLADAEMTVAADDNKYRANDRAVELFGQSETIRAAMTGSGSRLCIEESTAEAVEGEMSVGMCFTPEALPTGEHLDADDADIDQLFDCFDLLISEAIPFAFVLHDEVATIVSHNEVGIPVVVVESDDPAVYRWLERLYRECTDAARPVEETKLLA